MSLNKTLLHSKLPLNQRDFYFKQDTAVLEVTEVGGVRRRADSVWCCQPGLVSGPVLAVLSWCHSESPRQGTSRAVTLPGHATFSPQSPWTALSTGRLRSIHLHHINNLFDTSASNCVQDYSVVQSFVSTKLAIVVFPIFIYFIRMPGFIFMIFVLY